MEKECVIEVKNIKKTFNLSKKQQKIDNTKETTKVAVNNLSFTVNKGEIYGLLGSNGAGKTTTLRMISCMIKQDEGDILVNGVDTLKDPMKVRSNIAFLTSELKLENYFTPNYIFNYYAKLRGLDDALTKTRKEELFTLFGIDKFSEVKVGELSTGMQQKASLAISLLHNPDIIIFDEPTNGLDVLTAKVVTDYILKLKNEGKTIILSTHIFSLIEKVCDRVGIIINGGVVLDEYLDKLTKDKDLEDVFFDLYNQIEGEK
jgi:sodium transport system ATP-binding protein